MASFLYGITKSENNLKPPINPESILNKVGPWEHHITKIRPTKCEDKETQESTWWKPLRISFGQVQLFELSVSGFVFSFKA